MLCTNGLQELHVEVKGTSTLGEEVILTPGEVRHAWESTCIARHALAVCSEITVTKKNGLPECNGGILKFIDAWAPNGDDLTPTEYSYLVPQDGILWL